MWKNLLQPLFQADKALREYQIEEQWRQKRNVTLIAIIAFLLMSVLNIYQHSTFMLITTLAAAFCLFCGLMIGRRKKDTRPLEFAFLIILTVLFTWYIVYGGNEGFAILWVIFIPFMFMTLLNLKMGLFISLYFLILLFLLFYGPLDCLLQYNYPQMMQLRFPALYLIDFAFSFYSVREMITARSRLISTQEQLKESIYHDSCTGLKNRTAYTHFISSGQINAAESLAVIFIDVNGLHELNNRLGHAQGDKMLQTIADLCSTQFPDAEIFRLGGDEFLIICSAVPEEELTKQMMELNRKVEEKGYTISYGIEHRQTAFQLENMVNCADKKMLHNKAEYYKQRDRRAR